MLQIRKNIKFKKIHKKSHLTNLRKPLLNNKKAISTIHYGDLGLKAVTSGFLTFKQIEAARRIISRLTGRSNKIWIRIYPDHLLTKKSKGSRMGKGVGSPSTWVIFVRTGTVLFEINKMLLNKKIYLSLLTASKKLSVKTKILFR
jgi:large subunit ribosomal protein L16